MLGPVWKRAELLVQETQQRIDTQQTVVAGLEKRGLDATIARKHLAMLEEMLARRIQMRNDLRARHNTLLASKAKSTADRSAHTVTFSIFSERNYVQQKTLFHGVAPGRAHYA